METGEWDSAKILHKNNHWVYWYTDTWFSFYMGKAMWAHNLFLSKQASCTYDQSSSNQTENTVHPQQQPTNQQTKHNRIV